MLAALDVDPEVDVVGMAMLSQGGVQQ